ncbi:hypothetical protein EKO27_g10046 [Xylaria grammica]|uniref:Uncharacterized protein n=1 Tax=Xylaria grammica TaxID=363999 RepID=A0A439CS89_9PEZI|nr:hypothetical protein EKO27_g10046 [Xylaria grammica]
MSRDPLLGNIGGTLVCGLVNGLLNVEDPAAAAAVCGEESLGKQDVSRGGLAEESSHRPVSYRLVVRERGERGGRAGGQVRLGEKEEQQEEEEEEGKEKEDAIDDDRAGSGSGSGSDSGKGKQGLTNYLAVVE